MLCCRPLQSLVLGALLFTSACGSKLEGDWNGELDFLSISGDISSKTPARVHVEGDKMTLSGAPLTTCEAKVDRSKMTFQLSGGRCTFLSKRGQKLPVPDVVGMLILSNDELTVTFVPAPPDPPRADVAFSVKARRTKK